MKIELKDVQESLNKVILLMTELSGGLVKLGDVCNVNIDARLENFDVSYCNYSWV